MHYLTLFFNIPKWIETNQPPKHRLQYYSHKNHCKQGKDCTSIHNEHYTDVFLKGRNIGEHIRLLEEELDYVEVNGIQCLRFFSDFEKAFDSVDHIYLLETL